MGSASTSDMRILMQNSKQTHSPCTTTSMQQPPAPSSPLQAPAHPRQLARNSILGFVDITLRLLTICFLLIALFTMLSAKQRGVVYYYAIPFAISMRWSYLQPFRFQMTVTAVMAAYSLVQCFANILRWPRKVPFRRKHLLLLFVADQICAYMVLAATAAAAGAAKMDMVGFHKLHMPSVCQALKVFCNRATTSIIFTLLAAITSASSALWDAFLLFSNFQL